VRLSPANGVGIGQIVVIEEDGCRGQQRLVLDGHLRREDHLIGIFVIDVSAAAELVASDNTSHLLATRHKDGEFQFVEAFQFANRTSDSVNNQASLVRHFIFRMAETEYLTDGANFLLVAVEDVDELMLAAGPEDTKRQTTTEPRRNGSEFAVDGENGLGLFLLLLVGFRSLDINPPCAVQPTAQRLAERIRFGGFQDDFVVEGHAVAETPTVTAANE